MSDYDLFELGNIQDNPYQPRMSEDFEHILAVAKSIAADGLLQVPVGREIPLTAGIELAFGHTRLRAYRLLAGGQVEGVDDPEQYERMPVVIRELTDEEMFRFSVTENLARKDLTPIEEATAMQRYMNDFGKNSEEVGQLFNLSGSAVRGKIRLLRLPKNIQQALNERKISELVARELLRLVDLPADLLKAGKDKYWDNPDRIIQEALSGNANATAVNSRVDSFILSSSRGMDQTSWKWDEWHEEWFDEKIVGLCKECQYLLVHEKRSFCLNPVCYDRKKYLLEVIRMRVAREALNILPLGQDEQYHNFWEDGSGHISKTLQKALDGGCVNLRLRLTNSSQTNSGFPGIEIVCGKSDQHCVCGMAAKHGVEIPTESESGDSHALDQDALKEVRRAIREKRHDVEAMRLEMINAAKDRLAQALSNYQSYSWWSVFKFMTRFSNDKSVFPGNLDAIYRLMADQMVDGWANGYGGDDPDRLMAIINRELKQAGVIEMPGFENVHFGDDDDEGDDDAQG